VALPEGSQAQMSLYLRQNQLALALGRKEAFVANLLPLVQDCMARLQQDAEIMNDPALPKTLQRAIQRRRRYAKKSRVGAGEGLGVGWGKLLALPGLDSITKPAICVELHGAECQVGECYMHAAPSLGYGIIAATAQPGHAACLDTRRC
jgi:hypothetical protein